MKKYKKFTFILLIVLIVFVSFHGLIWQFTKLVYPNDHIVGDLARTTYKFDLITARKNNSTNLNKQHIHFNEYTGEKVDVITIGDSFSNGGAGGQNRYYQDYITSYSNLKVLNILNISNSKNYLETLMILINSGFIEEVKPKYIIVESVQRNTYMNLSFGEIDLLKNIEQNVIESIKSTKDIYNPKKQNNITFINNLNYNVLLYNLKFKINGYGKQKKYYIEKLNKNFFSSSTKDELIFTQDDIENLKYETKENLNILNDNLNKVSEILQTKGIKLYYMPVVDKFNLYRDNLLSKDKYPKSIFFEYLRDLPKNYYFIDTKKLLLEELNNNSTIDLYYSDDTHWSYKASEVIVKSLNFD